MANALSRLMVQLLLATSCLAAQPASASILKYEWQWDCYWKCANIGLAQGESVTGWMLFDGVRGPLNASKRAWGFDASDVIDYEFTLGTQRLDSSNTDIETVDLFFAPPNQSYTGGELIGLVELKYAGRNQDAFYLYDDSDVVWMLDPAFGAATPYTAAGPESQAPGGFGAYPPGWRYAGTIPEPSSGLLVVAAMLSLAFALQRRRVVAIG